MSHHSNPICLSFDRLLKVGLHILRLISSTRFISKSFAPDFKVHLSGVICHRLRGRGCRSSKGLWPDFVMNISSLHGFLFLHPPEFPRTGNNYMSHNKYKGSNQQAHAVPVITVTGQGYDDLGCASKNCHCLYLFAGWVRFIQLIFMRGMKKISTGPGCLGKILLNHFFYIFRVQELLVGLGIMRFYFFLSLKVLLYKKPSYIYQDGWSKCK